MFYVYILESSVDGDYYKGFTEDYIKRLQEHNEGKSKFTRTKMPWRLIYLETFRSKSEALKREKQLKRCNKEYLLWLVNQPLNVLNNK